MIRRIGVRAVGRTPRYLPASVKRKAAPGYRAHVHKVRSQMSVTAHRLGAGRVGSRLQTRAECTLPAVRQ